MIIKQTVKKNYKKEKWKKKKKNTGAFLTKLKNNIIRANMFLNDLSIFIASDYK